MTKSCSISVKKIKIEPTTSKDHIHSSSNITIDSFIKYQQESVYVKKVDIWNA